MLRFPSRLHERQHPTICSFPSFFSSWRQPSCSPPPPIIVCCATVCPRFECVWVCRPAPFLVPVVPSIRREFSFFLLHRFHVIPPVVWRHWPMFNRVEVGLFVSGPSRCKRIRLTLSLRPARPFIFPFIVWGESPHLNTFLWLLDSCLVL